MHDQAKEIVPRIIYEWTMLNETYSLRKKSRETFEHDAFLESFLIHARNLYDFLTKTRSEARKNDVVAEDFFDEGSQWNPSARIGFVEENRRRLDRSLAHLCYDRIDYQQQKRWVRMDKVLIEFQDAWDEFLSALPMSRRKWFLDHLSK